MAASARRTPPARAEAEAEAAEAEPDQSMAALSKELRRIALSEKAEETQAKGATQVSPHPNP